jgi:hypothetical protein
MLLRPFLKVNQQKNMVCWQQICEFDGELYRKEKVLAVSFESQKS